MSSEPTLVNPSIEVEAPTTHEISRISKLKLAFLYVLIGGLAASALIAIVALLIGSFNTEIQKSLVTIFIFFSHSLFILALLWADKKNEVGRKVLPTAIFALSLANMVTTTLATWEIITNETAWRYLGLYFLIIGAVFTVNGILKMRLAHKSTNIGLYATIFIVSALVVTLAPWVLQLFDDFAPLYYRVVAALSILVSTVFLIALILRGIALARHPQLHSSIPATHPIPGGLLAIYIVVASITAIVWTSGLSAFLISGVQAGNPISNDNDMRYY